MTLADIRDYIESLNVAENVYSGKLPPNTEKVICAYNSKHQYRYSRSLGDTGTYDTRYITLLVHWNRSQRDTEKVANELFKTIEAAGEVKVNEETIKFIQPLYDLQDVGTDEDGVYEMVIEMAVICERKV